jgi:hypothetical protein
MAAGLPRKRLYSLIAASLLAAAVLGVIFRSSTLERRASDVEQAVAAIRGLDFKHPIAVQQKSAAEGRAFVESEAAKLPKVEDYWAITRMLGLYRGPDLGPREKIYAGLADLVTGAYDENTDTLFLFDDMDERDQILLLVHELTHALQDQHFNLLDYLVGRERRPDTNADEISARQSVVEGEATYLVAIYLGRAGGDAQPSREQVAGIVTAIASQGPEKWDEYLRDPTLTKKTHARLLRAIDARNRLPRFMVSTFMDAYADGMKFVQAIHGKGWSEVDKLYRERPPESSEQILHPEKWFAREAPVAIGWPAFDADPLFADWELVGENVLGERLWREVFREYGRDAEASAIAAGWGGDRYAIFKHRIDGTYLMLTYTSWDTSADAAEFSTAYQRVLETKAQGAQARVLARGKEVLIVECPLTAPADALMEFNQRAVLTGG